MLPNCDENRAKKILIAKFFNVPSFNMTENPDNLAAPWFKKLWKEFLEKGHTGQTPQAIADEFTTFVQEKQRESGKDAITFLSELNQ